MIFEILFEQNKKKVRTKDKKSDKLIKYQSKYREYSIIRQLNLQQKSVGSRIVGLSNNFLMGLYWSGLQKKCRMSKLSDYRVSDYRIFSVLETFLHQIMIN